MRIASIYKITNPKGFIYIGSTINLKDRFYRYKRNLVKNQVKIYNSIKKYGWDNHVFEVIKECDEKDRYLFEYNFGMLYNVLSKENLNLKLPKIDDKIISISDETRKKISDFNKGKKISEEQKKSMLYNLRKYRENNPHPMLNKEPWNKGKEFLKGDKNPMYGIRRSDEWKENHSKNSFLRNKKGKDHHKSKIVLDLHTGIFYFSCKEVSECFNIKYSTLKEKLNGRKVNNTKFKYV